MSAASRSSVAVRVERIGDCTLYLGDCRDIIDGIQYDSIASDPPYGMAFRSNHRAEKHDAIANDQDEDILIWSCGLPARHSKYLFCRWDNLAAVPKPKSCVTWVKNNWSMGDLNHEHARQTEVALFYPGPDHFFPCGRPTDVVTAPRTGNGHHPTEKPVELMHQVVRWTDGVVIDPFAGSGTTGVACVQLGRSFIGIEREEKYFDIACRRIEQAVAQPKLFAPEPVALAPQESLFGGQ